MKRMPPPLKNSFQYFTPSFLYHISQNLVTLEYLKSREAEKYSLYFTWLNAPGEYKGFCYLREKNQKRVLRENI